MILKASLLFVCISLFATRSPDAAIVTTAANDGPGSLREALRVSPKGTVITFAPALSGATIQLTREPLTVTSAITIDASSLAEKPLLLGEGGANDCESCEPRFRIFSIGAGANCSMNGLAISGGWFNNVGVPVPGGCGILNQGSLFLSNCVVFQNAAYFGGAILNDQNASLSIFNSTIVSNTAMVGGAIFARVGSQIFIANSTIGKSPAETTGGIHFEGASLVAQDTTFADNTSVGYSGINFVRGNARLHRCSFLRNEAMYGAAGLHIASGTVEIIETRFAENLSYEKGGAIWNGGALRIFGSTFQENRSPEFGGAIASAGSLTIEFSNFNSNRGSHEGGGALHNTGDATISNSAFWSNGAEFDGGAVRNLNVLRILNSTFHDNVALRGGAIRNQGALSVDHCTIVGNRAEYPGLEEGTGGGVFSDDSPQVSTMIANSIVADNLGGLSPNTSGSFAGSHNLFANPMLAAFGPHGGPTPSMPPLNGSPAINAGAGSTAFDQRDYLRSGAPDIGAIEFDANAVPAASIALNAADPTVLSFRGVAGARYVIVASADPANATAWLPIGLPAPRTADPTLLEFTDSDARMFPFRFYRVRTP